MPTFCWHNDPLPDTSGTWGDCESGAQMPRYYACVDTDEAACSDGPYFFSGDYFGDQAGWTTDTGLAFVLVPNVSLTTGTEVDGGDSGTSFLPELTLEEGGLIAAALAGLWGFAYCIRLIVQMLKESNV